MTTLAFKRTVNGYIKDLGKIDLDCSKPWSGFAADGSDMAVLSIPLLSKAFSNRYSTTEFDFDSALSVAERDLFDAVKDIQRVLQTEPIRLKDYTRKLNEIVFISRIEHTVWLSQTARTQKEFQEVLKTGDTVPVCFGAQNLRMANGLMCNLYFTYITERFSCGQFHIELIGNTQSKSKTNFTTCPEVKDGSIFYGVVYDVHTQASRVEFYQVVKRTTEKSVAIRRLETKYMARGRKFACTPDSKFADSITVKGTLVVMKNECRIKAKVAPLYLFKWDGKPVVVKRVA